MERALPGPAALLFDDGKIGGVIRSVTENEIKGEIVKARAQGEKLWPDKGINLPESELQLPALTEEDIALLQAELGKAGGEHLGIILKIETRKAFERLPELILAAMISERVGIIIARGDLAVECGYERTGEFQEEIM